MQENRNTITCDENWQSVSSAEYPRTIGEFDDEYSDKEYSDADSELSPKPKISCPSQLLLTIQLILCLIIAILALVLKNIGGDTYSVVHSFYQSSLNNSVIYDGRGGFDLSNALSALISTADEV